MYFKIFLISLTLFFAGCAGTPPAGDDVVCAMETPTGSHLPQRVCRKQSTIDNDRRTVDMLDEKLRNKVPGRETRPGGNP